VICSFQISEDNLLFNSYLSVCDISAHLFILDLIMLLLLMMIMMIVVVVVVVVMIIMGV
jgi:hypothetical protein